MELNLINFIEAIIVWVLIIPELIYSVKYDTKTAAKVSAVSITESFGRYVSMILMILPIGIVKFAFSSPEEMLIYFFGNIVFLVLYIVFWIMMFKKVSLAKAIVVAILNITVFVFCGVLLRHWYLVIFALIFAIGHIPMTIKKFKEN